MNSPRFDALAKILSSRRSRRSVVRSAGLGVLAAGGFAAGASAAATPARAPTDDAEKTEFLFVQTFAAGTWAPKPDEKDTFLLTLTGHAAQTVYFSDRPERIVGTVPTPQFLDSLGFTPANPPNAAIVAQTGTGEDVIVVELLEPVYTEDSDSGGGVTLTYEAKVLAGYAEEGLAHLAVQQGDTELPASFGPASLFIDDCPNADIECDPPDQFADPQVIQGAPQCFSWNQLQCVPCAQDDDICNSTFPSVCKGACHACRPVWSLGKGTWDCNYWG